jgi:hypothetical protein
MAGYLLIQLTKIRPVLHTKVHPHACAHTLALSHRPSNRHREHIASITHLDLAYKRYTVNRISGLSSKLQVHHRTIGSNASVYECMNAGSDVCVCKHG